MAELLDALVAAHDDLQRHRTCIMELWALADRLPDEAREITLKYWNANCGPFDRAIEGAISRATVPPEPTVREVFSEAYGEVPEGATCHVMGTNDLWVRMKPHISGTLSPEKCCVAGEQGWESSFNDLVGPDISDRHASAFLGFFDSDYDAAYARLMEARRG